MYAVIRHYHLDKSESEEANRKVQQVLLLTPKSVQGIVAYYWLNTGQGEGPSLSVYQDKAAPRNRCAAFQASRNNIWPMSSLNRPRSSKRG